MFIEQFTNHLQKFNTSPFLFIGSGFSRRYLNLPTWENLLKEMVNKLSLSKPYEYYKSTSNSNLAKVATLMGEEFNEIWWNEEKFLDSRKNFQKIANTKYSPIKYEISRRIRENTVISNVEEIEREIKLLKKANIDGIITTNWDNLCEKLFPTFTSFIGQQELMFSELFTIGEIYKIHGSIDKPNTLVLTEEDYKEFEEKNSYLAAKLLTIFIETPVIFIGYSLSDENIQKILKSIIGCLTKDNIQKLQDRLIFCEWTNENIETTITDSAQVISDSTIPIKLIRLNSFIDLFTVLANNKKRLPIKVLRQMKGMVYDFVKSNNSKQKIFVTDNLDNIEDIHNAEFVYGVGIKDKLSDIGIKGIELNDLLKDIIFDNQKWDPRSISRLCLPTLHAKYIPYFKYLSSAGYLNNNGLIDKEIDVTEFSPHFISTVNSIQRNNFYPSKNYLKNKDEINTKYNSISEIINDKNNSDLNCLVCISLLDNDKICLNELEDFLKSREHLFQDKNLITYYRKLVCLYDFLKYKT